MNVWWEGSDNVEVLRPCTVEDTLKAIIEAKARNLAAGGAELVFVAPQPEFYADLCDRILELERRAEP